jgi:hypothetical protein
MRVLGALVLVLAAGCNRPTYLAQPRTLETTMDMMGMGVQADTDLYVLPVRMPTPEEAQALLDEQMNLALPMPVPWVGVRDFEIEILYSIKNLEDQKRQAFVTLDGGNEFGDYIPLNYVDPTADLDDQVVPPSLQGGFPIDLEANEIKTGVFREDQLRESALDLEAIVRYPDPAGILATPFRTILNNSTANRLGLEGIPPGNVTPAMVRLQIGLSANGHVVLDYNVRVRDLTGKLTAPDAAELYVDPAPVLMPPVVPPAAMMPMP